MSKGNGTADAPRLGTVVVVVDGGGYENTQQVLFFLPVCLIPICSMYGIFTNIYPINGQM